MKDMLATLGGLQYTKFYLNQAYIQLHVDEMFQPLLTFNAPKEFFHFLNLPINLAGSLSVSKNH